MLVPPPPTNPLDSVTHTEVSRTTCGGSASNKSALLDSMSLNIIAKRTMTIIPVTHYPQYCSQKALSPLFWHQCLKVATVKKKNTWHLVTAEVVLGRRDVGCDRFRLLKGQSGHVGAMKTAINAPVSMNEALLEKHSQPRNSTPRQTVNLHHIWQQWHQCNAGRKRDTLVCCLSQNSFWQHEAKYCKLKCFLLTNEFSGFYLSPPRCHFFFFSF